MNGASKFAGKARLPLMVLALLLAGMITAPFALSAKQQSRLPTWLQDVLSEIAGYHYWVLQLDREQLVANRLKLLNQDITAAFRTAGIADFEISEAEPGVLRIGLIDPVDLQLAQDALEAVKTSEFDTQTTPEGEIYFTYSSNAIDRASKSAINRFVETKGQPWFNSWGEHEQEQLYFGQIGTYEVLVQSQIAKPNRREIILEDPSIYWVREISRLEEKLEISPDNIKADDKPYPRSGGIYDQLTAPSEETRKTPKLPEGTFLAGSWASRDSQFLLEDPAVVSSVDMENASVIDNNGGQAIQIKLTPRGALRLSMAAQDDQARELALVIEGKVSESFKIDEPIRNGRLNILAQQPSVYLHATAKTLNELIPQQKWDVIKEGTNRWALIMLVIALVLVVIALAFAMIIARREPVQQRE